MKKIILSEKNYNRVIKFGETVDALAPVAVDCALRVSAVCLLLKGFLSLTADIQVITLSILLLGSFALVVLFDNESDKNEACEWDEPYSE